jgi:NADH-quinone oxidoreductase subunit N
VKFVGVDALAFFLLSLIGIPFTGGFFGKLYVFAAALHSGEVWLTVIGLVNSGVAAYCYLRGLNLYLRQARRRRAGAVGAAAKEFAYRCRAAHSRATFILGIFPGRILSMAQAGAATFVNIAENPNNSNAMSASR